MSSPHGSAALPPDERKRAFAVILAAGFMTLLDVSIVNIALPSIEASLDATPAHIQLIVAGYSLAFGLALVPAGRFGDVYGRRRMFLIGVIGFVIASVACGLAPTAATLAAFRLAQGVAAAIINPQVVGLIQQLFSGAERGKAFGMFGAAIGVSTALGPVLGGVLIAVLGPELGWRSVFLVNLPVGIILVIAAARYLPDHDRGAAGRLKLDVLGLLLLGITVLALMIPFVGTEQGGLANAPWWWLAVAAAGFIAFMTWEIVLDRRGGSAVLPRSLMRNTGFAFGTAMGTAYFAGFTGIWIVMSVYVQSGLELSAFVAGALGLPFAVTAGYTSARSGSWLPGLGRWLVVIGLAVMALGITAIDLASIYVPQPQLIWVFAALMAVSGAGSGVVISPNQTLTLADVPVSYGGTAGGVLQTTQRAGASVGLAVMTSVFFATQAMTAGTPAESYGHAFSMALRVTVGMIAVALVIAVIDAMRRRGSDSSS